MIPLLSDNYKNNKSVAVDQEKFCKMPVDVSGSEFDRLLLPEYPGMSIVSVGIIERAGIKEKIIQYRTPHNSPSILGVFYLAHLEEMGWTIDVLDNESQLYFALSAKKFYTSCAVSCTIICLPADCHNDAVIVSIITRLSHNADCL